MFRSPHKKFSLSTAKYLVPNKNGNDSSFSINNINRNFANINSFKNSSKTNNNTPANSKEYLH